MGPCMGEDAFGRTWLDRAHSYLTTILCQPSVWFDDFFGEHRAGEDWPGSLVRWLGSVRYDERDDEVYRSEFSADFRLPKMSKKLKLVVTSESRDEAGNLPDEDPYDVESPAISDVDEKRQTTAGLRYYLADTRKARLSAGSGLKFGDPVQPYFRLRLRYTQPLNRSTLFRVIPTAIWFSEDGIRRSLRAELDHRLNENLLARLFQSFVRDELEPGVFWGSALTLYDRLSAVTVVALETGATGRTHPENHVERYHTSVRLRSNFLRDWLYLEVEPEYYWPRDELGQYHLYRAITFRLEMQFYS